MYKTADFLEKYKELERWAEIEYDGNGIKSIEQSHPDKRIQSDVKYFRNIRNVLAHNPNGTTSPLIELTDEFKIRFEELCNKLMSDITQVAIPLENIYKRQMNDLLVPTISHMKENAYSYVPIMNGKKVWGLFSETAIFNIVGDGNIAMIDNEAQFMEIGKYITEYSEKGAFDFANSSSSIDEIRRMFSDAAEEDRRLDIIFITNTGDRNGDLKGLVTVWDISNI